MSRRISSGDWRIPLADLDLGHDEEQAVLGVLRSGWLTMGSVTAEFETAFADFIGCKHAIAVTNCTAALHLACLGLGIGPGDEVIVPSLTFVATANAIRYTGAAPVFANISSRDDFSVSADSIVNKITPNTKAIIVMHYGGYACDMTRILEIAGRHDLAVIEDAAHAPGGSLAGKNLGTWGLAGCFSFFSNKNLSTGEGGMIVTDDDQLAQEFRLLRSHGMTTVTWDRHEGRAWSYDVLLPGYNYRIDEIRAALGLVQLEKLPAKNQRRRALNELYVELFAELTPDVTLPYAEFRGESAYHIRPILLPEGINRAEFMDGLKSHGIQSSIHYPPIHQFSDFRRQYNSEELKLTEHVASNEVTLPLFPGLTEEDIHFVVKTVRRVAQELAN